MAAKSKKQGESKAVEKAAPERPLSAFGDMERLLETFFQRGWLRPPRMEWPEWAELRLPFEGRVPQVDVVDRKGEVLVRAELPGVDKKDLEISTTDNSVTIKGATRHEEKEEKGDFHRCEISRGSFSRTVPLPDTVDATKATATFKDGMLELRLPKAAKSRRRTIAVE